MLATISCLAGTAPDPAPDAHTPAGSAWHKPAWAEHSGYAPPPPSALLAKGEPFAGELEGALLVCEATTTHRGDRQRLLADLRGHDTTRPDMDVWLAIGENGVLNHGGADSASVRFGAPAVTLRQGEGIGVSLQDRGVFRKVTFDVMHAGYAGELPMALLSDESTGQCLKVPDELVQAALAVELEEFDAKQPDYAGRVADLERQDLGRGSAPDPRSELVDAAALVGWGGDAVVERVAAVEAADTAFVEAIGQAVVDAHSSFPDQVDVDGTRYVAHPMECPRWFGYRSYGFWSDCGIEVQVGVGPTSHSLEIVGSDGVLSSAGVLLPANEEEDRYRELQPGEVGVIVIPIHEPKPPYAIRVHGSEGPVWMAVPE